MTTARCSIPSDRFINRSGSAPVALETTLLAHGVPADAALPLAERLNSLVSGGGADPAVIGLLRGQAIAGMTDAELRELIASDPAKVNTSNLGVALHREQPGATTVSTTVEVAACAGIRLFATGGLGGVHRGYGERLDVSSDLAAIARFPVAVVTSGVKSLLDVEATREALETLGVPTVGFACDAFPAFYIRSSESGLDARFDDVDELAAFVRMELARTGRGIVICNPVPEEHEIPRARWDELLDDAAQRALDAGVSGRDVTPFILGTLHEISGGQTLTTNIELVCSNAALAGRIAAAIARQEATA